MFALAYSNSDEMPSFFSPSYIHFNLPQKGHTFSLSLITCLMNVSICFNFLIAREGGFNTRSYYPKLSSSMHLKGFMLAAQRMKQRLIAVDRAEMEYLS